LNLTFVLKLWNHYSRNHIFDFSYFLNPFPIQIPIYFLVCARSSFILIFCSPIPGRNHGIKTCYSIFVLCITWISYEMLHNWCHNLIFFKCEMC
jgi:hypothetical protein